MILKKFGAMAGAILVSGAVLAGAAFAAETTTPAAPADAAATKAAPSGTELSEGEKTLLQKLQDLRKSYMEKLQTESKALVDSAVADGTVTQEQGDRLLAKGGRGGHKGGFGFEMGGRKGGHGGKGFGFGMKGMTQEELKAQLDAKVAEGKLTQEQADEMLKKYAEHEAQHQSRTAPEAPATTESK